MVVLGLPSVYFKLICIIVRPNAFQSVKEKKKKIRLQNFYFYLYL